MAWADKLSVKKGDMGETIVDKILLNKGVIPYAPIADKAHPFDRLCATDDKKTIYVVEVKTKARRTYYADTGFNISTYDDYVNIQNKYGLMVYVFFVDEWIKKIYGGSLDSIARPLKSGNIEYPFKKGRVIYFPLKNMHVFCDLDSESAERLKQLSNRNYEYA